MTKIATFHGREIALAAAIQLATSNTGSSALTYSGTSVVANAELFLSFLNGPELLVNLNED